MEYGIQGLLDSINRQYDEMRDPFLKCKTRTDLWRAIKPYVIRIIKKYEDCCYGTITSTIDSFRNEIYNLECSVYHISRFSMRTIEEIVDVILEEQNYGDFCLRESQCGL
jgi:hypothetical protein